MPPIIVKKKKKPPLVVEVKKAEPAPKSPSPSKDQKPKEPKLPKEPKKIDLPEKPKGPAGVDKVQQHQSYLSEIESMSSPEKEMVKACYFLCFLFNETRFTTTLFPMKDQVLRKIFESSHDCLMVSYIRRGDRLNYLLTPEAEEQWKTETGGKQSLMPLYRTRDCYVERQKHFHDLYQFHIVLEPFRFLFYMPVELAKWVTWEKVSKPRLKIPIVNEYGLLRGTRIKMIRKSLGWTDEEVKVELQRFLDTGLNEQVV